MSELFECLCEFLDEDGWSYERLEEEEHSVIMGFVGDQSRWKCYGKVREDLQVFIFYSIAPAMVPLDGEALSAAIEYITRANYGLIMGNFELDLSDGEVRFKTSIDVEGAEISYEPVRNAVYANVMMMGRFLPGLAAVVAGEMNPLQAIEEAER